MLAEFAEWFKTKPSYQQRNIIAKLEEVFQIQNNFGYIQSLKDKIKSLESEISSFKVEDKYKEALQKIGELESYIDELEDNIKQLKSSPRPKMVIANNIQVLYSNIPKEERERIKEQVVACYLYKNLAVLNSNLKASNKVLKKQNKDLVAELVRLKNPDVM